MATTDHHEANRCGNTQRERKPEEDNEHKKKNEEEEEVREGEEKRYRGYINTFSWTTGYGFIKIKGEEHESDRDVFLHKAQASSINAKAGQEVTFTVEYNKQGKPQARNIEIDEGSDTEEKEETDGECLVRSILRGLDKNATNEAPAITKGLRGPPTWPGSIQGGNKKRLATLRIRIINQMRDSPDEYEKE
jgi:cold shock CspA family protein